MQVTGIDQKGSPAFRLRRVGNAATLATVGDVFWLTKQVTVIGRNAATSDIFLDSAKNKALISRLHARIIAEQDLSGKTTFKLCDTSLNGTYVNDIKVADTVELLSGDTVTFGHVRGAILSSGASVRQEKSEFRFQFEEVSTNKESKSADCRSWKEQSNAPKTPIAFTSQCFPNLSSFLTPCTPSCSSKTDDLECTVQYSEQLQVPRDGHLSGGDCSPQLLSDSDESDNQDLLAFAAAACDALAESDDDLFSLEGPSSPGVTGDKALFSDRPVAQMNGFTNVRIQDGKADLLKNETRVVPKKRRKQSKPQKCKKLPRVIEQASESDFCASLDCICPHEQHTIVSWVQCDDCDEWFHVQCTGLTLKAVKPKAAKFHCGCM